MTPEPTRRDLLRSGGLVIGGVLISGGIADVALSPRTSPALAAGPPTTDRT